MPGQGAGGEGGAARRRAVRRGSTRVDARTSGRHSAQGAARPRTVMRARRPPWPRSASPRCSFSTSTSLSCRSSGRRRRSYKVSARPPCTASPAPAQPRRCDDYYFLCRVRRSKAPHSSLCACICLCMC